MYSSVDCNQTLLHCVGPETKITFEQAITQFQSMLAKTVKQDKQKYVDVFRIYDRDGNGLISAAELRQILGTLGSHLTLLK